MVKVCADLTGGSLKSASGNLTVTIDCDANGKTFYSVQSTGINMESSKYLRVSLNKVKRNVKNDVHHASLLNKKKETGILPEDVDFVSMLQLDLLFRWFKFTLKPPYSIVHDKLRLAIWDTSFWTFWLKFGHKGP